MTLFLIDDNSMFLQVTREKLKPYCSDIYIFSSYKDALNNLELKPDIIFLDYLFDEKTNGTKIMKKIRKANPSQRVVIVSGQESPSTVHQLIQIGVQDYIVKDENYIEKMVEVINEQDQSKLATNPRAM
ncbi:MAG: response regulator [Bacteroidota bacterium]